MEKLDPILTLFPILLKMKLSDNETQIRRALSSPLSPLLIKERECEWNGRGNSLRDSAAVVPLEFPWRELMLSIWILIELKDYSETEGRSEGAGTFESCWETELNLLGLTGTSKVH